MRMKRMFAMAAMAAVCLMSATVFGQTVVSAPAAPAASSATECKKNDECADPTPVCDVHKVCRARTSAEERSALDKAKRDAEKANVKSAEDELAAARVECAKESSNCDSPTSTPIKSAEQRLAEAKKAAAKVGAGTTVAGVCKDTNAYQCSVAWISGTCLGSAQIKRCPADGVLAEINPQPKGGGSGGASEAQIGRLEQRLDEHGKRIGSLEGGQVAIADEALRTGARADEAYAAAVKPKSGDDDEAHASKSPPADADATDGSAGEVDADQLAGCVHTKARFLKRDRRLTTDAARDKAANEWCLASLR